jgi:hypothetical protein
MKHPAISKDRGIGFKNVNKFINKEAKAKGCFILRFWKIALGTTLE